MLQFLKYVFYELLHHTDENAFFSMGLHFEENNKIFNVFEFFH